MSPETPMNQMKKSVKTTKRNGQSRQMLKNRI